MRTSALRETHLSGCPARPHSLYVYKHNRSLTERSPRFEPVLSMADRVSLRQLVDQVIMDLRRRTDGLLRLDDAEIAVHNPVCMAVDDVALRLLALSLPGSQVATPADEAPAASTNPTATTTSTFISTHLRTTPILVPIVAAALLLGWARATGPAAYAHLRKATLELLGSLPPAECFALLGNVVRVASVGGRAQQQRVRSAPRVELLHHGNEGDKTPPSWPVHVLQTAQILMGRQLAAPGGIKGLMINLFGTELGRNEGALLFLVGLGCTDDFSLGHHSD